MALSRTKTWISGEVLTASDLNTEFNNILNNPMSLISPLTGALDLDGYALTLDGAAATQVVSTAGVSWNFTSGAKAGTPATSGSVANWSAQTFTDSNTAGSGTAAAFVAHSFKRPTLAATNASVTTTDAATVYIENAPAAGTNQTLTNALALWVDDGASRFDGVINMFKGADIASASTLNLTTATGNLVHVTGTTSITAVTLGSGMMRQVIFDGILTLTHHATDNNLPGSVNITTAAGDRALYWADGTTVSCVAYQKASGESVVATTFIDSQAVVKGSADPTKLLRFEIDGFTTATTRVVTIPDADFTMLAGAASQAQQEAGSSVAVGVTPGRQQYHPSAAKGWCSAGVTGNINASYNVTSVTDGGAGKATVNWTVAFSGSYAMMATALTASATSLLTLINSATFSVSSSEINTITSTTGALADPDAYSIAAFGDQA